LEESIIIPKHLYYIDFKSDLEVLDIATTCRVEPCLNVGGTVSMFDEAGANFLAKVDGEELPGAAEVEE